MSLDYSVPVERSLLTMIPFKYLSLPLTLPKLTSTRGASAARLSSKGSLWRICHAPSDQLLPPRPQAQLEAAVPLGEWRGAGLWPSHREA